MLTFLPTFGDPHHSKYLVAQLDAGDSSSYSGSGQNWYNLVTSPADGAAQSDYDFYLGTTSGVDTSSDPVFNGVAGNKSSSEYFYGGASTTGGLFTSQNGHTTFINSLHKDNASGTLVAFVKTGSSLPTFGLYSNADTTSGYPSFNFHINSGGYPEVIVNRTGGGGALTKTASTLSVGLSEVCMVGVSFDESREIARFIINNSIENVTSFKYTLPSTDPAGGSNHTISNSQSMSPAMNSSSGARFYHILMYNEFLTENQLHQIFNEYNTRYGL